MYEVELKVAADHAAVRDRLDELDATLTALMPSLEALASMLGDTVEPDAFTPAEIRRYREAMARTDSVSGPLNYYRATARETLRADLRALLPGGGRRDETVDAPTLVVWGEQDRALSPDVLEGLDRWVPDLTVRRLPAASHWVQADAPGRVTDELRAFLR